MTIELGRRRRRQAAVVGATSVLTLAVASVVSAVVSFSAPSNFRAGNVPLSVAVGDFNADGDPDLAVANFRSDNVSVLLGGAGGSFSGPVNFAGR